MHPAASLVLAVLPALQGSRPPRLELREGDHVALVGNTFAEQLGSFGDFEAELLYARPELKLRVRNLGWSGDTVSLRPRPLNFGDLHDDLARVQADVVLLCYGMNEAFEGEAGLPAFERDLAGLVDEIRGRRYGWSFPPRVVLVGPIPHEDLGGALPDGREHDAQLELYTRAMERVADERALPFVDLRRRILAGNPPGIPPRALTFNGIHLTAEGSRHVSSLLLDSLGIERPWTGATFEVPGHGTWTIHAKELVRVPGLEPGRYEARWLDRVYGRGSAREWAEGVMVHEPAMRRPSAEIGRKNQLFFQRWRPVNGEYVFGRRAEPFGVVNFPPEMEELDRRIEELEQEIDDILEQGAHRVVRLEQVAE